MSSLVARIRTNASSAAAPCWPRAPAQRLAFILPALRPLVSQVSAFLEPAFQVSKNLVPQGLRRRYQFICKFSSLSVASFVIGRAIHHIEPDNFARRKKLRSRGSMTCNGHHTFRVPAGHHAPRAVNHHPSSIARQTDARRPTTRSATRPPQPRFGRLSIAPHGVHELVPPSLYFVQVS